MNDYIDIVILAISLATLIVSVVAMIVAWRSKTIAKDSYQYTIERADERNKQNLCDQIESKETYMRELKKWDVISVVPKEDKVRMAAEAMMKKEIEQLNQQL
mgnify:CR=1 FL=1